MPILYNCRHDGDQFRITKFDDDMNPQGSYLLTEEECECPAGVRPTCRHRQMLPKFLQRQHVGDEWFFDYDRGGWVQLGSEWAQPDPTPSEFMTEEDAAMLLAEEDAVEPCGFAPPKGVTMIVLDNPEKVVEVHNAIAEAIGEPTFESHEKQIDRMIEMAAPKPPAPTHMKRRL